MIIPNIWKNKIHVPVTTNQIYMYIYIYIHYKTNMYPLYIHYLTTILCIQPVNRCIKLSDSQPLPETDSKGGAAAGRALWKHLRADSLASRGRCGRDAATDCFRRWMKNGDFMGSSWDFLVVEWDFMMFFGRSDGSYRMLPTGND